MYCSHVKEPIVILEAVASHDLWILYAIFGLPGSNNDINVLHISYFFDRLAQGEAPAVKYALNGHNYDMDYYLADGIYPNWSTFVKTIKALGKFEGKTFCYCSRGSEKRC
jgi:hypothetical protein